jgi:putative endonuclease
VPDARQLAGRQAENAAAALLETHGLRLLERNARFRLGEWDLVMLEDEVLVFVEVRLRHHAGFGGALASVDRRKQRKLARAALAWTQRQPLHQQRRQRFDVVGFHSLEAPPVWIRDAWRVA